MLESDGPICIPTHALDCDIDGKLRCVGWEMFDASGKVVSFVSSGQRVKLRLMYRVTARTSGSWQVFIHVEQPGTATARKTSDHVPLLGKYGMEHWLPGDIIVDDSDFNLEPNMRSGPPILILTGFFSGNSRMPLVSGSDAGPRTRARGSSSATFECSDRTRRLEHRLRTWVSANSMSNRRGDSEAPTTSRRAQERVEVTWDVDCRSDDTFLFANITNVSALGLFVRTERPLLIGTKVDLSFSPTAADPSSSLARSLGSTPTRGVPTPGWAFGSSRCTPMTASDWSRRSARSRTSATTRASSSILLNRGTSLVDRGGTRRPAPPGIAGSGPHPTRRSEARKGPLDSDESRY